MKLFKGLPLYEATIDMFDETGMEVISLVEEPAVEVNFIAFKDDKELLKYSIENEEQHMIYGLVMACDRPIYRIGNSGFEYYIQYGRDTIAKMAEKYFKLGFQNNVDTAHSFELEDGITLVQMFIKDSVKGINPIGFEEYADGSLFAQFHVENEEVWNGIKEGSYKGFSLAGLFNVEETFSKQETNKQDINEFKMKIERMKEMLRKMLAAFGEVSTDKGVLIYDGNEDLKAGDAVHSIDAEGNDVKVEDGEYATEDGKIIIVKDGKVEEIKDKEAEVAPNVEPSNAEEPINEEAKKACQAAEGEDIPAEPAVEEPKEDLRDARIKELEAEIAEKIAEIEALKAKIKELEDAPAAKPADEAFEAAKEVVESPAVAKLHKRGYKF